MKKLESTLTNMVLVLTGVAVVMGGVLAWVNHLTSGPIEEQKEKALASGIRNVMCTNELNVASTDSINGFVVYKVTDARQQFIGAAVESTTMGFGGELKVLVGFAPDGRITGYTLLEHAETPGLGAKADQWFQSGHKGDIIGRTPEKALTVSKDGGEVDAITASTITSRAFLTAVNNAYNAYRGADTDAATGASKQITKEEE